MQKAAILAAACLGADAKSLRTQTEFDQWALKHGKVYSSAEERAYRRGIFDATSASIKSHMELYKRGEMTYTQATNKFSDLTHTEFLALNTGKKSSPKTASTDAEMRKVINPDVVLPTSVDWRTKGAVTPVKDQGQCGSCWTFGSTFVVEGAVFLGSGKLISLSEQQIVSCDTADGNSGCNGGEQLTALQWLAKGAGQCTEADYPYTSGNGQDGKCKTTCKPAATVSDVVELASFNATLLQAAVVNQPVSISVDASGNGWQSYSGGVYNDKCNCNSDSCLDHAVGLVGYDTTQGAWIVRNSWSASWGDKGYIYLPLTATGKGGACGILIDNQVITGKAL